MEFLKNGAALALFLSASCLPVGAAFGVGWGAGGAYENGDYDNASVQTAQNKKPVPVLVEELFHYDYETRQSAYQELKQRDLSGQDIKFLVNMLLEHSLANPKQEIMKILQALSAEKREVLYSIYRQLPLYQKFLPAKVFATFTDKNSSHEGVEFLMNEYKTASYAERELIMRALRFSSNYTYEDIRPMFLSEDQNEHRLLYGAHFNLLKFDQEEIRDVLYHRMIELPYSGGVYAKRAFASQLSGYFNQHYGWITAKLESADGFERIFMLQTLLKVQKYNTDLFIRMMNIADGRTSASEVERGLAETWLQMRVYKKGIQIGPDKIGFYKKYRNSQSRVVRRMASFAGCSNTKEFYDLLYLHLKKFQDEYAAVSCLYRQDFNEETARRFYPVLIHSEISLSYKKAVIVNKKHESIALSILKDAVFSKNEKIRRDAFSLYLKLLYRPSDFTYEKALEFEAYTNHPDFEIAVMAMEKRFSYHLRDKKPAGQNVIDTLIHWYKERKIHGNEKAFAIAVKELAHLNQFSAKDLPALAGLVISPDESTETGIALLHAARAALLGMSKEFEPNLIHYLTGDPEVDLRLFSALPHDGDFWPLIFQAADQKKFSDEYFLNIAFRRALYFTRSEAKVNLLLERLKEHPEEPYVVYALAVSKSAQSHAKLWSSLYNKYSSKELSDHNNMLIFSLAAYHLQNDRDPTTLNELAALFYFDHLWTRQYRNTDEANKISHMTRNLRNPAGIQKVFSLIRHKNEWVQESALRFIADYISDNPAKVSLSKQNIKDLIVLQKSSRLAIRGCVALLLFYFQDQALQWNPQEHFTDLAYSIGLEYEGYRSIFLHTFRSYPEKQFSFFEKCFSIAHEMTEWRCLYLFKANLYVYRDISPMILKIMEYAEHGEKNARKIALDILCKRAVENKKIIFPFLNKILRPSKNFPEDLDELAMKTELLTMAIYLEENGKELLPSMIALYNAIERVSNLTEPPEGYLRGRVGKLYQLYDLKLALTDAFLLFPENEAYIKKSLFFKWNYTSKIYLPNYFWQAWRRYPESLTEAGAGR